MSTITYDQIHAFHILIGLYYCYHSVRTIQTIDVVTEPLLSREQHQFYADATQPAPFPLGRKTASQNRMKSH
jgi:hypothetical protein